MSEVPEQRIVDVPQLRADAVGEDRVVRGLLVPYGVKTAIGSVFTEEIAPHCFEKSTQERAHRLPLLVGHDHHAMPVGSAIDWEDRGDGLWGVWRMADTVQAREVFGLIRDGHVSALSVGFAPVKDDWDDTVRPPHVVRQEARLLEASVVPVGAYEAARVSLRSSTTPPSLRTPRLDATRRWLEQAKRASITGN